MIHILEVCFELEMDNGLERDVGEVMVRKVEVRGGIPLIYSPDVPLSDGGEHMRCLFLLTYELHF